MVTLEITEEQARLVQTVLKIKLEECDRSLSNLEAKAGGAPFLEGFVAELHIQTETLRHTIVETLDEIDRKAPGPE